MPAEVRNRGAKRVLSGFGIRPRVTVRKLPNEEQPLRSELFTVEQMQSHGRSLAESHKLGRPGKHNDRLLGRLVKNEAVLNDVRVLLTERATIDRRMVPAADWFLDNFYLVEEHIRMSKRDLPKGYSRGLPRLEEGQSSGLPRVYDIALERISHGDGIVDPETLVAFLEAYQSVAVLTLGELWAVPIMLRLALIENLRRVAARISAEIDAQSEADSWADRMTEVAVADPKSLILLIADMARSDPPMVSSFVAELARRLQGKGPALALPLTWIEQRLSETGLTIERLVQTDLQQQAADQVSISNSIRSLRSLDATDWKEFVENTSSVEHVLREDPAGCYRAMDFSTRDRYRHVVEAMARRARLEESDIARRTVQLALDGLKSRGKEDRTAHVGFYLVDKGFELLSQAAGLRMSPSRVLSNLGPPSVLALYIGAALLLALTLTFGMALEASAGGMRGWQVWLATSLTFLCAGGPAIALVNWIVTLLSAPHPLPRMDFSDGISPEFLTLVVVPAMLSSTRHIDRLVEALEVRWLANRDENLFFGLLTDLPDAAEEIRPLDAALTQHARHKIEELNNLYKDTPGASFFLFHRGRRWNARERLWMGHERKRGKLSDLNALLRDDATDRFELIVGPVERLPKVKYVITLDTDTQLPRDSARRLVGTMAHPLNHARYDEKRRRIVEGYGILQPRVVASLPGANLSLFARLSGNEPGIDPYTHSVSDVYQDLFREGSFVGKGIYDVDAFERALKGRFPENRILSHDLLEGCYARSGLVSDVQLFEQSPPTYLADVERRRRWIRGDWQLLRWLFPYVAAPDGTARRNALSALSRWKIFDNLRRSLAPTALTLLLLLGWTVLKNPLLWSVSAVGLILMPFLVIALVGLFRKATDTDLGSHLASAMRTPTVHLVQGLLSLAFLPYEAYFGLTAIVRTAWRLLVTHRRLLEWEPSDERDRRVRKSLVASFRAMWFAPFLATATVLVLLILEPSALLPAALLLILWLCSPGLAWWVSRPTVRHRKPLSSDHIRFLGRLSRKTWAFFETFVTEEEHWLPPDNFQELPSSKIAHRTSPTNIGLSLLANLAAHDFGFITAGRLIERSNLTLESMSELDRYRNHFYNWYDTKTLQPLLPRYVSTVDSGNLSGHLLTLQSGLSALPDGRVLGPRTWDGIADTQENLTDTLTIPPPDALVRFRDELDTARKTEPADLTAASVVLARMCALAGRVREALAGHEESDTAWWAVALEQQCRDASSELEFLVPWLSSGSSAGSKNGFPALAGIPTLRELFTAVNTALRKLDDDSPDGHASSESGSLSELREFLSDGRAHVRERIDVVEGLCARIGGMIDVDYGFLYDKRRRLLSLGYDVDGHRRDLGYYDLLASEARLASFIAIGQGQIPQESWFALGRLLAESKGKQILFSWSGSMFEYLMPLLVMPMHENTLLGQTCKSAVFRQIDYGRHRGVPWGVSESGYNAFDVSLNYQYRAFGVPGLGLKRGLVDDLVIAPYASALALMIVPEKACVNLQRLSHEGFEGAYGLYEAIDYTASRVPSGQSSAIVRSFMAHHQGMSLLSMANCLLGRPMQKRFASIPMVRATALLLEEKIPRATTFRLHSTDMPELISETDAFRPSSREYTTPDTPFPEVHLLSNDNYHVMVTNAGGGYSRWKGLAVTRWIEDDTRDNWGSFLYIRDLQNLDVWSNTFQPTLKESDHYEAIFSEGRAEFRRTDHGIDTYTEVAVSPEDDVELRRVRIANRSRVQRAIEVTSYAEVVLASPASDATHPGFSNLFVQTEIIKERKAILCTRRPRSSGEEAPWLLHLMTVRGTEVLETSFETDRMRFIGRGCTLAAPRAMNEAGPLSGSHGSVLDPIVAIRNRIVLEPDASATFDLVTGIADTREAVERLVEKYQGRGFANRVFELSRTHSQVVLQQINGTETDAQLYGRLAGSILYSQFGMRADAGILLANRRGQPGLWGYSISGDLPIVLLQIEDPAKMTLVRQLVQAHAYWRQKGLPVDLVIWNEEHGGYRQELQDQILSLITAGSEANVVDRPGGIFLRSADQIAIEDRILIQAASRVVISDRMGTLEEQIEGRSIVKPAVPRLASTRAVKNRAQATVVPRRDLLFFNGIGGFSPDGREYIITTAPGQATPAPWSNVIANAHFGTVVSEAGGAYTWSENAHEFRISPWHDDPVGDTSGEALYVRDEESGQFWSPTPLPRGGETPYVTRHGFGYSVFEHSEAGISSELWTYVAIDAPVKFVVLKLRNESGRTRRLSATAFVELVLGEQRSKSQMHVVTEIDSGTGAIFARNSYNTEFAGRTVFLDGIGNARTMTGDRGEFLGRNGTFRDPDAMSRTRLSGRVGAGLDPCAATQLSLDLADGQEGEAVFVIGAERDRDEAEKLTRRFRSAGAARRALEEVRRYWGRTIGAVTVETPDTALNLMANGWLLYQVLSCRLWGRSGYYQSGGAFGFRDQLQDAMALIHTEPALVREHLLRSASRQFPQGDVQHWWHPLAGRGSRSRCSDDFLWLPLATSRYVSGTGDTGVLDELVDFIDGRPVAQVEESYYDLPTRSDTQASLYEHCVRAIERAEGRGAHGLPLIGSGDWNDGMNVVGELGTGESVWLAFFLIEVLTKFSQIALLRNDLPFATRCRNEAEELRSNIEKHGWDGAWYRRAFFDDGSPLGSATNEECQIDSIAQSWSVLSGSGSTERSRRAMESLDERLVRRDRGLIQLLDPPFDRSQMNPGYIKGYVPGVRENGGQYTHAAVWAAMAFARLGDSRRAWELFSMINPVNHSSSPGKIAAYKVEPYVLAADVYSLEPHAGRGGWTWYTGSAGWMYRLIVESILGLSLEGDRLRLSPCLPENWNGYRVDYRYRETLYHISVTQIPADRDDGNEIAINVDGREGQERFIPLVADNIDHLVRVTIRRMQR